MKQLLLILLTLSTVGVSAQNVNIPDANFKAYLVGEATINTNGDSEISTAEAGAFTGGIYCVSQNISSLEGIEAFTALTELVCDYNDLSSLDIRQNTALTVLSFQNNNVMSIDLSQNTALTNLTCRENQLSSLDVSNNTDLTELRCQSNDIANLDISQNTALVDLTCNDNNLMSLDLSQHTGILSFDCSNNQLTSLNLANGNNMNISGFDFYATGNPSLTCIQVDDVAWSNANWTNKDATASYSVNCSLGIEDFGADVSVSVFPNPASSQITLNSTQAITAITLIDITGKEVAEPEINSNSIDISYLSKGLYFLQIETTGGSVVEKFVKR